MKHFPNMNVLKDPSKPPQTSAPPYIRLYFEHANDFRRVNVFPCFLS